MNDVIICLFAAAGFDKAAQGLAGAGRRLADELGAQLRAIVVGEGADALAAEVARVADAVTIADQAELAEYQPETCLAALTLLCGELQPRAVLLSNDTYSQELAPRLAYRLGGSAAGDGVEIQVAGEALRVSRQVYGGKAQAVLELKRAPAVVWLRARSFAPAAPRDATGEITRAALAIQPDTRTRIIERKREAGGESRLEEARVIVSGGRGIGGPEPFETELKPLADLLKAQMAASRAACDAGWVPPTWQVGQTGKKVTPELYLGIAITGASQHMAGISEAKVIAAINTDPDAPIFKHSRFGIVEDYRKVVPLLREKLAALLSDK
ncbi:MAG: electron transfer flavoprotein alpha subunit [Blastocatellia bacterium]|jgi:electron transfer flavoprotein alpha subunit|nr:electron transfer flavoprotein alpha subunit [Blastocatellia bacterium]